MNNLDFNKIIKYKNLLTGLNNTVTSNQGMLINGNTQIVDDVDAISTPVEYVTLIYVHDTKKPSNQYSQYPFLCDTK